MTVSDHGEDAAALRAALVSAKALSVEDVRALERAGRTWFEAEGPEGKGRRAAIDAAKLAGLANPEAALPPNGGPPVPIGPSPVEFSEDQLALAFSEINADVLRFVPAWNQWLRWDGRRFAADDVLAVFDQARTVCRQYAADLAGAATPAADRQAVGVSSAKTVYAVERLARADPRHARRADDFDADPWELNTPGGVVDLRSGQMRPHSTDDLHTKCTAVAPSGDCPRFLAFLDQIFGDDAELVDYVQRWAGYSLTGLTREHAFLFAHGPGGNGKSVLLGTIAAALGDYAMTAMADIFTINKHEQHPTHLASLRGARMVVVSETEEGRPWAEARLKSLTGGDRISARVMRGDLFEFTPCFKLWIAGNHRPVLRNPDAAMKRRLHLVHMTFVPVQADQELAETLRGELAGILAWAIEGCRWWQSEGLGKPDAVKRASEEYFEEQDRVGLWFDERCVRDPLSTTFSRRLFKDFTRWANERGELAGRESGFSEKLERLAAKKRTKAGVKFIGIDLKGGPDTDNEDLIDR